MTNVVSGATAGTLDLRQTAIAGAGGAGNGGAGGNGGNASSMYTASNPGGGTIVATATAQSGAGGSTFGAGTPGNSGDATANINISNMNNTAMATANAFAGLAGVNFSNSASGTRGVATSMAHATTTGGFLADATAIVNGRNPFANAVADTSNGILNMMSLSATANPVDSSTTTQVHAYGRVGSSFDSFPGGTVAHGSGLPVESDVDNNLSGDPIVTAAYHSPDGKTPLALAALNLISPNLAPALTTTFSASASFSFDVSTLQSGNLLVGLLDPISSGPGFTSLHFSIEREGAIVEDQTFATMAAATMYFDDNPLDLSALKAGVTGTLDLEFSLEMTTFDNGTRYGVNFLVADVGLVAGLPGDYNGDNVVDEEDYTVWRDSLGSLTSLPNDDTAGVGPDDYDRWKAHFGETAGSGAGATVDLPGGARTAAIPEPASVILLLVAAVVSILARCRLIAAWRRVSQMPGGSLWSAPVTR
jgi:hypothetical protein